METLKELFEDMLKDVYFAEKSIVKALPKLAKHAMAPDRRSGFQSHLDETKDQIARLEKVFMILGEKPSAKECPAILGLITEADELIEDTEPSAVADAGLAAHARAVEHYEIARYTALHGWAETLAMPEAAALLAENLDEEIACQDKLASLADKSLNSAALGDGDAATKPARAGKAGSAAKARQTR